jgi:hypothetical protein
MSLKDKLKKEVETTGKLEVSSADVAAFEKAEEKRQPVEGDVKVEASQQPANDPVLQQAAKAEPGKSIDEQSADSRDKHKMAVDLSNATTLPKLVTITDDDRAAFLEAIVTGERFKLPFTLFNGKIKGVIRSRKQAESHAILSRLSQELRDQSIVNEMDYAVRLRNMLLVTQVDELQDTAYAEMKEPYMAVKDGEKLTDPGWIGQMRAWEIQPEGLVTAVYKELQKFEQKYWTMVENADDQDFWNPAESTSE